MKTIKRIITHYKQEMNLTPFKTVKLETGIICQHYRNGTIKVL